MRALTTVGMCCCLLLSALPLPAAEPPPVSLTIYNAPAGPYGQRGGPADGYAVVREIRQVSLAKGRSQVRFSDVARTIDAATVRFESLTDPARTFVVEQAFEFDLVSADKLFDRYIDRPLTIVGRSGTTAGTLLAYDPGSLVVRTADADNPVQIVARGENIRRIVFPELPGGLITKPTLVWEVDAQKQGDHRCQVSYQAGGIGWAADYTLVLNGENTHAGVSAWVTIHNQSGATYRDAGLKLVAGDVNRVQPQQKNRRGGMDRALAVAESAATQFEEKALFEYHLYTLQRTTTIPENSIRQIELFPPAREVPVRKLLVYYGAQPQPWWGGQALLDRDLGLASNDKVDVYLELKNTVTNRLGLPLPKGTVRVYQQDPADRSLEFVGEDAIDHTPKDETVLLKLGEAFDIRGERVQADFRTDKKNVWETFTIRLKNRKENPVSVLVKENLYRWSNWAVEKASHPHQKQDARTIHFEVKVPAGGETTVGYTVRYWGW